MSRPQGEQRRRRGASAGTEVRGTLGNPEGPFYGCEIARLAPTEGNLCTHKLRGLYAPLGLMRLRDALAFRGPRGLRETPRGLKQIINPGQGSATSVSGNSKPRSVKPFRQQLGQICDKIVGLIHA